MTENSGLSLTEAMLWKRNEVVSASEFVLAMQSDKGISYKEALIQFGELIKEGLPIYDTLKLLTGESQDSKKPVLMSIIGEMSGNRNRIAKLLECLGESAYIEIEKAIHESEIETLGGIVPMFSDLRIFRDEAFKLFADIGITKPYPWPYPPGFPKPDPDEIEETTSIATIQSADLLTADQQRLPIVLAMVKELGFDPLDIPRRGKTLTLDKLLERHPGKITKDKFEETWKFGKRDGLLKMRL